MTAPSLATDDLAHQGRLVLINSTVDPGASNRPEVTAAANRHTDTVNTERPHRDHPARAVATIAATASATTDPAGSGNLGSGSSAHANLVNAARNGPARAWNRRTQPRTVDAGRPSQTAMRRWPHPSAAAASPAPITSAESVPPDKTAHRQQDVGDPAA